MKHEKYSFMPIAKYRETWFIGLPLRIKAFVKSYSQRKQYHLMDDVIYKGKSCFINNGTRYANDGTHLWDICERTINPDGKRNTYAVSESELYRPLTWFNFCNARLFHYKWYMNCWYAIDLRKRQEAKGLTAN